MLERIIVVGLVWAGSLLAESRIHLGDDEFRVVLETPLTGWIEEFGPRFDTTAAVISVELAGKEFLAPGGLVDEFNPKPVPPPGYLDVEPGQPFLKVGVGILEKLKERGYLFRHPYPVLRLAPVASETLEKGKSVRFSQEIDSGFGWAYHYEKTYTVNVEARTLDILYSFTNRGENVFKLEQYNHNWFRFDQTSISKGYELASPLSLNVEDNNDGVLKRVKETLILTGEVDVPFFTSASQDLPVEDNRIRLEHTETGQWVEFKGDFPVQTLALYMDQYSICPEVFIYQEVASGETASWSRTYHFGLNSDNFEN